METRRRIPERDGDHSLGGRGRGGFAVIIPVLNEAAIIADAVTALRRLPDVEEILVVDGASTDGSGEIAREAGAQVLRTPTGRGLQMNLGAGRARADHLVFLHADCRLPERATDAMREVFASGHDAGVFAIDYASPHPLLRLLSWLSHLRSPWTEFGEAGLFVRRALFQKLGGFPDWPLFEDQEMLARLRRVGALGRARGCVRASPRRYLQRGVWRQQCLNFALFGLFRLGVSPTTLARMYQEGRLRPEAPVKAP